jgi:hypothetical protein
MKELFENYQQAINDLQIICTSANAQENEDSYREDEKAASAWVEEMRQNAREQALQTYK